MSYPFDKNPFEKYFPVLRDFRKSEWEAYRFLCDDKLSVQSRSTWANKFKEVKINIKNLIADNQIPPRLNDIYLGEIELALEKHEHEFPKPEKPAECNHSAHEIRLRHHADSTSHIVTQCLLCGRVLKDHKKSEVSNWEALPSFEEEKRQKEEIEYSRWWEIRNEILTYIIGGDGRRPEFDYEAFTTSYKKNNPKPKSPSECEHKSTLLTLRKYSESNTSVVLQCRLCGKHLDNVPKKSVKNLGSLPDFNVTLEEESWGKVSQWSKKYSSELKSTKKEFDEISMRKIQSGEISVVDKTTFGSYYESKEWFRTRERIFERDGCTCQSCGNDSECVHHLTYDRLGRENDLDLISLCNICHHAVHAYQDTKWFGYRLTPIEIRDFINDASEEYT